MTDQGVSGNMCKPPGPSHIAANPVLVLPEPRIDNQGNLPYS